MVKIELENEITKEEMMEIQMEMVQWQYENMERELDEYERMKLEPDYLENYSNLPVSPKFNKEDYNPYTQLSLF